MCCGKKCIPKMVFCLLVTVGALNWGLVGIGMLMGGKDLNLVHMLVGQWPMVEAVVYVLVGLSAILKMLHSKMCPCMKGACCKGCCCGCKCDKCAHGDCCKGGAPKA